MFILYAVVLGLAIGLATGGRLSGLATVRIRWVPLILVALLAQVALFSDAVAERIGVLGPAFYVGTTMMVGAAVLRNLDVPGFRLIALGALSNLAAILANGGFMPAAPGAIESLGKHAPTIYSNSAVIARPALQPLTDLYALPRWMPFANVFSIGDVLLAFGIAVVVVLAMRRSPPEPAATRVPV
jgi:uncharacterized protein DUF5317